MTNYEAILKLNPEGMESFGDQVFVAGLNTGNYAAGLEDEQQAGLLGINPHLIWHG